MIVNGGQIPSGPADIGFEINASNSILRGLAIGGFGVGVSVPNPTDVGDLIQGNFIGEYLIYPVNPETGIALPSPETVSRSPAREIPVPESYWDRQTQPWVESIPRTRTSSAATRRKE